MTTTEIDLIPTHVTSVVGVARLSERFLRVTFGGGLGGFDPVGPDQFVYVLAPPPGQRSLSVGTDFRWSSYYEMPEEDRPIGAYYTVRRVRAEVGEIDCDVHLHHPAGAASAWAASVGAGQPAALWGPRTAWDPPPDTTRVLLVADETGIPAIEAILESLPSALHVTAIVEVGERADAAHVDAPITWIERGERPAGTTEPLVDAVRSLDLAPAGLYAWGGAESRAMRDVRAHLRRVVGLDRAQVSMTPYWRHARHAGDPPDDDA